jgi:hypothetical protein
LLSTFNPLCIAYFALDLSDVRESYEDCMSETY